MFINDGSQVLKRFPLGITFDTYSRTHPNVEQMSIHFISHDSSVCGVCVWSIHFMVCLKTPERSQGCCTIVIGMSLGKGWLEKVFLTSSGLDFKLYI